MLSFSTSSIAPVFRFAKISNGAYFFTGSELERNRISTSFPDFRAEDIGFYQYVNNQGTPVYRFANLSNGGYFYTASPIERDNTAANFPNMRYEGSTFSVASAGEPGALPVYRLANTQNGAYLYTTQIGERDAAVRLGFWRDEGVSFYAPRPPADAIPADVTPPSVVSLSPANGSIGVALGSNIVVNFNEAIQRDSGTVRLINAAGAVVESFDARSSPRIAVSGSTWMLDPSGDMSVGTTYRLEIPAGSVRDMAGNAFAGLSNYTFTAFSNVYPVYRFAKTSNGAYFLTGSQSERELISSTYPDFRSEGVGFFRFQDNQGTPVYRFANLGNGGYFYTGSAIERDTVIRDYPSMRYEGSSFSVASADTPGAQPVFRLANASTGAYLYTVSTAERDAALQGGSWRFEGVSFHAPSATSTPRAAADGIGPAVLAFSPADEANGVALGSNIVLTFDEPIRRGVGTIRLISADGRVVESFDAAGGNRIGITDRTLTIDPSGDMGANTDYRLELPSGSIRDTAGNPYAGTTSYNFSTRTITAPPSDDFKADASTTGRITVGANASGSLEIANDSDWFAVGLEGGREYIFNVATAQGSALRPSASLVTGSGAFLGGETNNASAQSAGFTVIAPTTATYYIAVRAATGSPAATGTYTVNAQIKPIGSVGFIGEAAPILIEGAAATPGSITLSLQRSGYVADAAAVTVRLSFDGGTSASDIDLVRSGFAEGRRIINFTGGQDAATFTLFAIGDLQEETPTKSLLIQLVDPVNMQLASRSQLRLTIQDDDRGDGLWNPAIDAMATDPGAGAIASLGPTWGDGWLF